MKVDVLLFIYIYIYTCVCVCVCVCVWTFFFVFGPKKEKINISKWIGPQRDLYIFKIIYFVLTYEYVSSLLLSSENICGTKPYEWGTQWDSNSQTNTSDSEFHWLSRLYGLVPHMFS